MQLSEISGRSPSSTKLSFQFMDSFRIASQPLMSIQYSAIARWAHEFADEGVGFERFLSYATVLIGGGQVKDSWVKNDNVWMFYPRIFHLKAYELVPTK